MSETQRIDNVAEVYGTEVGRLNRDLISHYTLELIKPLLNPSHSVLLMGIGDGEIAYFLNDFCQSLTIIEGSGELIREHSKLSQRSDVIETLFEEFEPRNRFDVIVGTHVLEHVEDPVNILNHTTHWLSSSGIALFTVPNRFSLHRRIGKKMGLLDDEASLSEQDILLGHRRVYKEEELKADILAAGYSHVDIEGYLLKIVPNRMMKEWNTDLLDAVFDISRTLPVEMCADLLAKCRL
jgi:2-polyprenyl-3-methyl-5-hydroxy-6-metoxy-1,4-benzoquinol methylase